MIKMYQAESQALCKLLLRTYDMWKTAKIDTLYS